MPAGSEKLVLSLQNSSSVSGFCRRASELHARPPRRQTERQKNSRDTALPGVGSYCGGNGTVTVNTTGTDCPLTIVGL